jgi:hypothetical protein
MLAPAAEFGLPGHAIDLVAHLVERHVDALTLGLDVLGNDVFDGDARLMIDGNAAGQPLTSVSPRICSGPVWAEVRPKTSSSSTSSALAISSDSTMATVCNASISTSSPARIDMLDTQDAHRAFTPHDGHAREEWNRSSPVSGR